MDRKAFWNEVAKYGLLLGIAMGGSKILEQSLAINGDVGFAAWIILEWLLFAVLFFAVLYRATKKRAASIDPVIGFSFSQSVNYMMLISVFAAVPVACIYYIFIDMIIGYDNYVAALVNVLVTTMEGKQMDSATASAVDLLVEQMRSQAKPSIFSILFSTIFQYAFAGLFAGLILAGFTSRKAESTPTSDEK